MREEARCVIVGGGAMGVGLLYHLAHEGWTDTVLIEKGELTSGSTWHAAGLVPHFIGDLNMAKVHQETVQLYRESRRRPACLRAGTDVAPSASRSTTRRLLVPESRTHGAHGVESHIRSPRRDQELNPLFENIDDVKIGFYTPHDGWTDPTAAINTMAKGARQLGARSSATTG